MSVTPTTTQGDNSVINDIEAAAGEFAELDGGVPQEDGAVPQPDVREGYNADENGALYYGDRPVTDARGNQLLYRGGKVYDQGGVEYDNETLRPVQPPAPTAPVQRQEEPAQRPTSPMEAEWQEIEQALRENYIAEGYDPDDEITGKDNAAVIARNLRVERLKWESTMRAARAPGATAEALASSGITSLDPSARLKLEANMKRLQPEVQGTTESAFIAAGMDVVERIRNGEDPRTVVAELNAMYNPPAPPPALCMGPLGSPNGSTVVYDTRPTMQRNAADAWLDAIGSDKATFDQASRELNELRRRDRRVG